MITHALQRVKFWENTIMTEKEYKECIISLLKKIHSTNVLRKIYDYVNWIFTK